MQVGNVQFSYALQQLVDLSYLWSLSTHLQTTNATIGGRGPAEPIYLLNDDGVKVSLVPSLSTLVFIGSMVWCIAHYTLPLVLSCPAFLNRIVLRVASYGQPITDSALHHFQPM